MCIESPFWLFPLFSSSLSAVGANNLGDESVLHLRSKYAFLFCASMQSFQRQVPVQVLLLPIAPGRGGVEEMDYTDEVRHATL